jgi:hypothetical protein
VWRFRWCVGFYRCGANVHAQAQVGPGQAAFALLLLGHFVHQRVVGVQCSLVALACASQGLHTLWRGAQGFAALVVA